MQNKKKEKNKFLEQESARIVKRFILKWKALGLKLFETDWFPKTKSGKTDWTAGKINSWVSE